MQGAAGIFIYGKRGVDNRLFYFRLSYGCNLEGSYLLRRTQLSLSLSRQKLYGILPNDFRSRQRIMMTRYYELTARPNSNRLPI